MKNNMNFNNDFPDFNEFISSFSKDNSSSNNDNNSFNNENNPFGNIDMNTVLKMRKIMENMNNSKNNPRANLLLSLKPYLRQSRKQKIDQYIQLFSMGELIENLEPMGGENVK